MPMSTRTRTLRFTAVLTFVVLGLTGFSSGRHHSRHSGSGGGGCSSSHQDHDSSSSSTSGGSSYDDDSSGTSGSGGGGTYRRRPTYRSTPTSPSATSGNGALGYGTVKLVSCATEKKPYATVEVTNPSDHKGRFTARVNFVDADDITISFGSTDVSVPAKGTRTVKVQFGEDYDIGTLDHCEAQPDAYPVR
ncbi:hypothetical protein AB0N17_12740 [Streptomyces sp. NPDC051133]|uniref:hypothetical protein n=1 Tax=Streptomyces sp. NPDC051133 TaxID=3155521 RepID=UPI003435F5D0